MKNLEQISMNNGFKDTNIGPIPVEWDLLEADEIKAEGRSIISGPFGSNISRKFFVESGIPVIRGNNLTTDMDRFKDKDFVFLTKEKADELNTYAEIDDIIFTAAGTLGQVGIIENDMKYDKYIISNKQLRLRINSKILKPLFAFYWFSSPWMIKFIEQHNTGSTIPLINLSVLKKLPIPIPSLNEQKRISNILDSLDQKIKLNRQINQRLESIGQAIFKHWFVDFEFPDENSNPYKSSGGEMVDSELGEIPKGWDVGMLGDLLKIEIGGDWGRDEKFDNSVKVVCLRGVDLRKLKTFGHSKEAPIRWVKKSSLLKRELTNCDILIGASGLGPVGRSLYFSEEINKIYPIPIIYSNFCKRLKAQSPETANYSERFIDFFTKRVGLKVILLERPFQIWILKA
ncbi:MAG: restriction endonuclease subunit S [Methanobacterium sp. ERen5]|nr:MAG: restriction endonuclease subunit S [Methanobacterium sp. ERen5]